MSAQLQTVIDDAGEFRFQTMEQAHLDQVCLTENAIYKYPWTKRNFSDSIEAGYHAEILFGRETETQPEKSGGMPVQFSLIGYFVLMHAVDEAHLLNISVAPQKQKHGYGRQLLERVVDLARQQQSTAIMLEVRVSNQRASAIYRHHGFETIGIRKGYYPNSDLDRTLREDATVMRLEL